MPLTHSWLCFQNCSINEQVDTFRQQAAGMGVLIVGASATGTIQTKPPLIETLFPTSPLADRTAQVAEVLLECGFPPATMILKDV